MTRWSKATRLALHAALELARAPRGEVVTARHIAERYAVSQNHLAKILAQLTRGGIVRAVRGVGGGYTLAREPDQVTLLDVVVAVEGPPGTGCSVRDDEGPCLVPCALRALLDEADAETSARLQGVTLAALARAQQPPPPRRGGRRLRTR